MLQAIARHKAKVIAELGRKEPSVYSVDNSRDMLEGVF